MKINFETILPDPHSSFKVKHIDFSIKEVNWEYHYHPEVEIVCVISGTGTRHVGYNKSNYIDGDLVLIGKNIPHSGFGIDSTDPHEEIVVQFNEKLILSLSHTEEFIPIKNLLDKN